MNKEWRKSTGSYDRVSYNTHSEPSSPFKTVQRTPISDYLIHSPTHRLQKLTIDENSPGTSSSIRECASPEPHSSFDSSSDIQIPGCSNGSPYQSQEAYSSVSTSDISIFTKRPYMDEWMVIPEELNGSLMSGLEWLAAVDQIFTQSDDEFLREVTGVPVKPIHTVKNKIGQKMYYVVPTVPFDIIPTVLDMNVIDKNLKIVMELRGPTGSYNSLDYTFSVFAPHSICIGTVRHRTLIFKPLCVIKDIYERTLFTIRRPRHNSYAIHGTDHKRIGMIFTTATDSVMEMLNYDHFFGIDYPLKMFVEKKALIFAAALIMEKIDFRNNVFKKRRYSSFTR